MTITPAAYFAQHGAGHESELTDEIQANAAVLLLKVNSMLLDFGQERGLRSGWRPAAVNAATPNAAHASRHITGQAVDIEDADGKLKAWALARDPDGGYPVLEQFGLWAEYGEACPGWLHCQSVPPGSGMRVYYPTATWAARAAAERLA